MSNPLRIIGQPLPNIPWEPRPAASSQQVWRFSGNPLIDRHPIPCAYSIFNSAVLPFEDRFVAVFRTEYKTRVPYLHLGWSKDGLKWDIAHERIEFAAVDPEIGN